MKTENAAFGIYRNQQEAEKAVQALEQAGYNPADITLILPHARGQDFGYLVRTEIVLFAIVGALVGVLAGAMIGGFGGGDMFFDSPTTGLFFGAIMGFFLGAASGALVGIGTPQTQRQRYLASLKDGSVLLSVHEGELSPDPILRQILEDTGGSDISEENETDIWTTITEVASTFVKFRPDVPRRSWLRRS